MKTHVYRKHIELLLSTISCVLVEKGHWCNYFRTPLPQNFTIFHSMWHMILLIIFQISEVYIAAIFVFCCYLMEILCYIALPWTIPWKYVWKKCDQKHVSLVCIDRWKSDKPAFFKLTPGISITHRHSANWKIGSPFVPPDETKFHSGPRTTVDSVILVILCAIPFELRI